MKTKVALQDIDLIYQYVNGDDTAFEALFSKHKDKVYTSIYVIVKDHEVADDIFQDTFIKVLQKLKEEKYAEEGKFVPWVLRIAHNLCMDHFRKKPKGENSSQ